MKLLFLFADEGHEAQRGPHRACTHTHIACGWGDVRTGPQICLIPQLLLFARPLYVLQTQAYCF